MINQKRYSRFALFIYSNSFFITLLLFLHYEILSLFGLVKPIDSVLNSLGNSLKSFLLIAFFILFTYIYLHQMKKNDAHKKYRFLLNMASRKGLTYKYFPIFDVFLLYIIFLYGLNIFFIDYSIGVYTIIYAVIIFSYILLGILYKTPPLLDDVIYEEQTLQQYATTHNIVLADLAEINDMDVTGQTVLTYGQIIKLPINIK